MSRPRRRLSSTPPAASTPGKKRKRPHYDQRLSEIKTLLYPRAFTAKRLNTSLATVLRMEQQGILDTVRLMNSPAAQVYHKAEQVDALARGERA